MNSEELKRRIGARFRRLRKEKGFSSAEKFANQNDFSRPTYGKYEQGKPNLNVELDTLIRLCESYGITLREFWSEGID